MYWNADKKHRWAVVLAGGEGARLHELTRRIAGEAKPKQFCRFLEGKTLLTHTRERIAPLFDEERVLFVLTRSHERFYREQLAGVDDRRKVIQPMNRGTAVAMALSLELIARQDDEALVAFFPCDHHFSNCSAFRNCVEYGLGTMDQYPESLLVLGAEARYPEVEYGWIEPGRALTDSPDHPLRRVKRFWEKPSLQQAQILRRLGCMWNTFVTIGLAGAFMEVLAATIPEVTQPLASCLTNGELERFYDETASVDFSKSVLSRLPGRLMVLRDTKSGWMDLGNPDRVLEAVAHSGIEPPWFAAVRNGAAAALPVSVFN